MGNESNQGPKISSLDRVAKYTIFSKQSQGLKALAGPREMGSWSKYDFLSPFFFKNCKEELNNKMN